MTGRIVGPSENDILLARRLQRKGASLQEIHDALGWDCVPRTTQERLLRGGLRVRIHQNGRRAHYGDNTTTCEDLYDKQGGGKAEKT